MVTVDHMGNNILEEHLVRLVLVACIVTQKILDMVGEEQEVALPLSFPSETKVFTHEFHPSVVVPSVAIFTLSAGLLEDIFKFSLN